VPEAPSAGEEALLEPLRHPVGLLLAQGPILDGLPDGVPRGLTSGGPAASRAASFESEAEVILLEDGEERAQY